MVGLVELTESHFYYQMLLVLVLLRLYCKSFNVLVARARSPKAFAKLRRLFDLAKCSGKFNVSLTFRRELFHLPSGLRRFASAKVQHFSEPAKYFRKFFRRAKSTGGCEFTKNYD